MRCDGREEGRVGREQEQGGCGCTAGLPTDVHAHGGGGPTRPMLAVVHPFLLGTPEVGTPSQRRQSTA